MNIRAAADCREVVDCCDCIMVLAPNDSDKHEELADYALRSGKPVYIDKTFAPTRAAAQRMFELADQHRTPLMSTSALRYSRAVQENSQSGQCRFFSGFGGGQWFEVYAVHQVEMVVALCGVGARRVMVETAGTAGAADIAYDDGRMARIQHDPFLNGFQVMVGRERNFQFYDLGNDPYFARLMETIAQFFLTGVSAVPREQTLEAMAILEAIHAGIQTPGEWVNVPH